MALDMGTLIPLAERAARSIAADWPGLDPEDARQEMLLAALQSPKSLEGLSEGETYQALKAVGTRWASRERYAYTFHSAQYVYTPAEVRGLFEEAYFEDGSWEQPPTKEDYRLRVEGGGVVIALWDIKNAFEALAPTYRQIIVKRYRDGAALSTAERKTLQRAIDNVTRAVNRAIPDSSDDDHDGPGARHAISNAKALSDTTRSIN